MEKLKEFLKGFSKEEKRFFKVMGCFLLFFFFIYVIMSIADLEGIRLHSYFYFIGPVMFLRMLYYLLKIIEQFGLTQFGENQFRKLLKFLKLLIVLILILDVMFIIKLYFFGNSENEILVWASIWAYGVVYDVLSFVFVLVCAHFLYNLILDFVKEKCPNWIASERGFKAMLGGFVLILLDFTYFASYHMVHSILLTYLIQVLVDWYYLSLTGVILSIVGFGINFMEYKEKQKKCNLLNRLTI